MKLKTIGVSLSLITALAFAGPAKAAKFSFSPPGQQLDSDSILDILLRPGEDIRFLFSIDDTTGLTLVQGNFLDIFYNASWDASELTYDGLFGNPGFPPPRTTLPELLFVGEVVAAPGGGLAVAFSEGISGLDFIGADVNPWPGDGMPDFTLTVNKAELRQNLNDINPADVTGAFDPRSQTVEVQQPVPGPLPLLGAGVAFGYSRKLRKRIAKGKSLPVSSAID